MRKYIPIGLLTIVFLGALYALVVQPLLQSNQTSQQANSQQKVSNGQYKTALFAGGCFWSLESYFEKIPEGVIDVVSGYSGGTNGNPTYENYKQLGHKEVVQVTYDPAKISYTELTDYFFRHIDPTDPGGSFYDRGANYTSAIYYTTPEERDIANQTIKTIDDANVFDKPIVTEVLTASTFWPAEEYHQNYAKNNSVRYTAYRIGSGRDDFLKKTWERQDKLRTK